MPEETVYTLQDLSNSVLQRMKRFSRSLVRKYVIYITWIRIAEP